MHHGQSLNVQRRDGIAKALSRGLLSHAEHGRDLRRSGALRLGLDRHTGGDRAACEDVSSQATAVDESPEGAGLGEPFEVSAGLTEALTETLDVADEFDRLLER